MATKPSTTEDPFDLWLEYQFEPTMQLRNQIAEHYLSAVRMYARQMETKLRIDADELYSAGVEGLLDAMPRFEIGRGWKFLTFARARILGSMLDYSRVVDPVSRLVREHRRLIAEASDLMTQVLNRAPTDEELHDAICLSEEGFRIAREASSHLSLETVTTHGECRDARVSDELAAATDVSHELSELREVCMVAMKCLNARERRIVTLYWLDGWTMAEIALDIGLSESRVSQLHSQCLEQMREYARKGGVDAH